MYLFPLLHVAGKWPVWLLCIVSVALWILTYIIYNEYKDDGSPFVVPEAGCGGTLIVAMLGQMLSEEIIGQFTSLFQPINPFCDLEVHPIIEDILGEVVLINELLGDLG